MFDKDDLFSDEAFLAKERPSLVKVTFSSNVNVNSPKRTKRIVSLDSSGYSKDIKKESTKGKAQVPKQRSLSAGTPTHGMHRLNFETIDLGNTPLSSLRSCSEFNKFDYMPRTESTVTSQSSKRSFFSRLFGRKKTKKPSKVSLSTVTAEEQSFFIDQMRQRSMDPRYDSEFAERFLMSDADSTSNSKRSRQVSRSHNPSMSFSSSVFGNSNQSSHVKKRSKGRSIFYESSLALDVLFGIGGTHRKEPMEIELLDMKSLRARHESFSRHDSGSFLDLREPRNTSFSRISEHDDESDGRPSSSGGFSPTTVQIPEQQLTYFEKMLNMWESTVSKFAEFGRRYIIESSEDLLYDSVRIQPFAAGAYFRGLLLAGYTNTFLCIYSLALWPDFKEVEGGLTPFQRATELTFYGIVLLQAIANLCQTPFRCKIHYLCWESSRAIDVNTSIANLRSILHCEEWSCNRTLGRILDIMAVVTLVLGELFIWFTPETDPVGGLVVSLLASLVLVFLIRLTVSIVFSISIHDPQVLADARRRGLSQLDIQELPTFVFTQVEEVNNSNCPICLSGFEMGEMLISLPCDNKHSFHAGCIRQWLQRQNSCPLCQKMI